MADIELGQSLHISDIKLPNGVESVALSHGPDHDLSVVTINKPKAVVIEDTAPEAPANDADDADDADNTDDADTSEDAGEE